MSQRRKKWYQIPIDWFFFHIVPPIAILILRALYATMRWKVQGRENLVPFWDEGRPVIMAFWHGRLLMMPGLWERKGNAHVLIGNHRNGELITRIIAAFGIGAVRGSANARGAEARQEMMERYFEGGGRTLGFTPDGPHGPRFVSKMGMASLSRKLNLPVIWISASARPAARVPTWDRFLFPAPFSRAVVRWGNPIDPARFAHLTLEEYRDVLDDLGRADILDVDEAAGNVDEADREMLAAARERVRRLTV